MERLGRGRQGIAGPPAEEAVAYSKPIDLKCETCQGPATKAVFDENGALVGYFCEGDAEKKKAELEQTRQQRDAARARERRG